MLSIKMSNKSQGKKKIYVDKIPFFRTDKFIFFQASEKKEKNSPFLQLLLLRLIQLQILHTDIYIRKDL